jgi:UDP-N-acetylglucosamine--N-acetylmuramyl-(pentapeptide) pyrophosphoryl-undecaprenol N-acetylglucosamine transferase
MSGHTLLIMAGGTGGHIMPGLAVAHEMRARGWSVSWLGTRGGMENRLVPPAGIPLDTIGFRGLRGKGTFGLVKGGVQLLKGFTESFSILRRRGADVVLGMGGYVCFPGGLVAHLLRRPLMLVNADAGLLLSNRSLLRWADRVAFGFDGPAARGVAQSVVTGNPVRGEIESLPTPAERFAGRSGPLKLLVVGGSLGAQVLNQTLPPALAQLAPEQRPQVVHQTGEREADAVKAAYAQAGLDAEVVPFIDQMDRRLADCDLIVCRAGAITVSELCAAGVASVLVPLVVSTTQHQRDNAAWLAGQGAAVHLPQTELNSDTLAATLAGLDRTKLLAMAEQARALALPHAAQRVADQLEALAGDVA